MGREEFGSIIIISGKFRTRNCTARES
jgi:hypothetical protein